MPILSQGYESNLLLTQGYSFSSQVINVSTFADAYITISTQYGNIRKSLTACTQYLDDAIETLVTSTGVEITLDLLPLFNYTSKIQKPVLIANYPFYNAIHALNNHILTRELDAEGQHYPTISSWLLANNIKVTSTWADMCSETGIIIPKTSVYCSDCGETGATC